jgi:hypothetical protein
MARSGRWDIQEHAGEGHYNVRWGKGRKDTGPYYAYRRLTGDGLESFDAYRKRVVDDVEWGMSRMKKEIPGFMPYGFAVPFGNYGQLKSNDPRIKSFFGGYLQKRFRAVFVVQPAGYTTQNTPRGRIGRLEVHTYTTAGRLYTWLTEKLPSVAGELRVPPQRDAAGTEAARSSAHRDRRAQQRHEAEAVGAVYILTVCWRSLHRSATTASRFCDS